jgi:hypothetical protein
VTQSSKEKQGGNGGRKGRSWGVRETSFRGRWWNLGVALDEVLPASPGSLERTAPRSVSCTALPQPPACPWQLAGLGEGRHEAVRSSLRRCGASSCTLGWEMVSGPQQVRASPTRTASLKEYRAPRGRNMEQEIQLSGTSLVPTMCQVRHTL